MNQHLGSKDLLITQICNLYYTTVDCIYSDFIDLNLNSCLKNYSKIVLQCRSAIIQYAQAGTIITVFDNPSGSKDDDYTVIKIRNEIKDPVKHISLSSQILIQLFNIQTQEASYNNLSCPL